MIRKCICAAALGMSLLCMSVSVFAQDDRTTITLYVEDEAVTPEPTEAPDQSDQHVNDKSDEQTNSKSDEQANSKSDEQVNSKNDGQIDGKRVEKAADTSGSASGNRAAKASTVSTDTVATGDASVIWPYLIMATAGGLVLAFWRLARNSYARRKRHTQKQIER